MLSNHNVVNKVQVHISLLPTHYHFYSVCYCLGSRVLHFSRL